jgi:hypothetical protein
MVPPFFLAGSDRPPLAKSFPPENSVGPPTNYMQSLVWQWLSPLGRHDLGKIRDR